MTTSLNSSSNHKSVTEYLAEASGINENEIGSVFAAFEIDDEFRAHRNLIEKLNHIINHHGHDTIFAPLVDYQRLTRFIERLLPPATATLHRAAPTSGKDNNLVPVYSDRPIATLLFMPKQSNSQFNESIDVLTLIVILALFSNTTKSSVDIKNIKTAATKIRTAYTKKIKDNPLNSFSNNSHKTNGINGFCKLIRSEAKNRENEGGKRLFSAVSRILPLIDKKTTKYNRIRHQHVFDDPIDTSTSNINTLQAFASTPNSIDDVDNDCVFLSDAPDYIYNIEAEKTSRDISKSIQKETIESLLKPLSETQLDIIRHSRSIHSATYISNDHLKYKTNLFNPIERHWLSNALRNPEEFGSSDEVSILVALSICTGIDYPGILKLTLGSDADITCEGFFKRKLPDVKDAAKPGKKHKHLYKPHLNDCKAPLFYLPLPGFIQDKIRAISKEHPSGAPISQLFENHDKPPGKQVKKFIRGLNNRHGQRFNTNRISCQMRQYIKSRINDPCITYALFGHSNQYAPSAYYYRSTSLTTLVDTFQRLSMEYFT